jgi:hypothetical protein
VILSKFCQLRIDIDRTRIENGPVQVRDQLKLRDGTVHVRRTMEIAGE